MEKMRHLRKIFSDAIKLVNSLDRSLLPVLIFKALFISAVPFVAIILSAEIINRLSGGGEFLETLIFAIISVGAIFVLTLVGDFLRKKAEVKRNLAFRLYDFKKSEKTMTLDYSELESPAFAKLRAKLRSEENLGFGLPLLLSGSRLDFTLEAIFSTLLSLALFLPAFATADYLHVIGFPVFLLVSIVLTVSVATYQRRADSDMLEKYKDDNYWSDEIIQFEVMALSNIYTYKEGMDIRIYKFQSVISGILHRAHKAVLDNMKEFAVSLGIVRGVTYAVRGLLMGGSFIFVAVYAAGNDIELGTVILLASLLYQFMSNLAFTITDFSFLHSGADSLQTVVEFLAVPDSMYKGSIPTEKRDDNVYEIEFRDVSFKYEGSETYALKNLNLKLSVGKRLAVVGMNGSGKTTMIKLLCRLYDPTEGEILLNGIDIRKYNTAEYQSIFSVVFQDFQLFSFELGQVLSASADYDSERAKDCLKLAGLDARLESMPHGVKTVLYKDFEDGVDISGGEAQKIAIARALYKDAPFVVLDEPTASLDPISEFEVYSKFNEIAQEKTTIFISHRLSSCRFCHDIAVFHEGKLIQRGGHDELLADEGGKYQELWNAQAKHYNQSGV